MQYTSKQHYISKYILKRFADERGKLEAILLHDKPKRIKSNIEDICCQKDFYEDKDQDGNYIERNRTENRFAKMEMETASYVDNLLNILSDEEKSLKIRRMIESGEYDNLTVKIMLHLTLVLIRLPQLKTIVFKDNIPLEIKQLFYKQLLWGTKEAKELAEKQFKDKDLKIIKQVLDENSDKSTGITNILLNYLINNYDMKIYEAPTNSKFYLSDNPVIVNEIEGIDYFLPLSPKFAVAMKKFKKKVTILNHGFFRHQQKI